MPQALELNPGDQNALVTRSKCYLLLGEPAKGLSDAEEALAADTANIRAIYQKAEALYFLGQFEHSLMFFHRGLRLRPEMNMFRLGVQKSRQAIEKTIGGCVPKTVPVRSSAATTARRGSTATATGTSELTVRTSRIAALVTDASSKASLKSSSMPRATVAPAPVAPTTSSRRPRTAVPKLTAEQREAKRLLGELCVDKQYLQDLLKNPSIRRADAVGDGEPPVTALARDAVEFLNTRQEFWRQQRPCTAALPLLKKRLAEGGGDMLK